jgi:hypothetical protein
VLKYQRSDSTLTLQQGLLEYYASREGLVRGRGVSPAAREFFLELPLVEIRREFGIAIGQVGAGAS